MPKIRDRHLDVITNNLYTRISGMCNDVKHCIPGEVVLVTIKLYTWWERDIEHNTPLGKIMTYVCADVYCVCVWGAMGA